MPPDSELGKTVAAVEEALIEYGMPLPLGTLYEAVTAKGVVIKSENPRDVLGARLYNSGRFQTQGRGKGWWFKDRPLPGAVLPPPPASTPPRSGPEPQKTAGGGTLFAPAVKLNGGVSPTALMSLMGGAAMGR